MKRLIVNADDFGLTDGVNRAILRAHQQGIVTSATLLANGLAFDSAVKFSRQAARLGVGVHLNLSEGRPVADPHRVPSLLNEAGMLCFGPLGLATRLFAGNISLKEVEFELSAQIERVRGAGIGVTHLDGHKHIHMLRPIFRIVVRLASKFGVRGVRCSLESGPGVNASFGQRWLASSVLFKQYLAGQILRSYARGSQRLIREAGLCTADFFMGLTQTGLLDPTTLVDVLQSLPEGVTELMCHPGYLDDDLRSAATRLLAHRECELEALTDPRAHNCLASQGTTLISYRDLAELA